MGIIILFYISPKLTGVLLSVIPFVAGGAVAYGRYVRRVSKSYQDALGRAGEEQPGLDRLLVIPVDPLPGPHARIQPGGVAR